MIRHSFRAFTLIETLITMLVTGILLLAVMDGMMIFFRLQLRKTETLIAVGRARDGYFRLRSLVAEADSITLASENDLFLRIWHVGNSSTLRLQDSALLYEIKDFQDSLMSKVAELRLVPNKMSDTVVVKLQSGLSISFPSGCHFRKRHNTTIENIEAGYDYEEK